jgi:hypothetical protein
MSASILALGLAYVFLLFLVLLAILKSELGPGLKLVLAALCLGFYLWHYNAMQQYLGWPAEEGLPERFEVISSFTVEPDLQRDEPGGIFLWVRDLDSDLLVPRSYRLNYRKPTHRKLDDVLQRQQQGERFVGTPIPGGAANAPQIEFESVPRDAGKLKSPP